MLRRSFGLLAALGFVLCIALGTMWVRELPPPAPPPPIPPRVLASLQVDLAYAMHDRPPDVDLAKPIGRLPPFKGCQLRDVLDWLSGLDAGSVDPDWPAIEGAGIRQETPVPHDAAAPGTFGTVLADVLLPMGLAFATDGHLVYVSTPAGAARLGHMRHLDRFEFTTRADSDTASSLGSERNLRASARPPLLFDPDSQSLRAAGIEFRIPVPGYSHATTGVDLENSLRESSGTTPLRYQIRDGRIAISTAAAIESADHFRNRVIAIFVFGFLVASCTAIFVARRRRLLGQLVGVTLVLTAASVICVPICSTRPDACSARLGRSRWTVGLGPGGSFVLSSEPAQLEEVFMSRRSGGRRARIVYCDRLGFYAAREGAPYPVFNAHAPRRAVIGMAGLLPLAWFGSNVPALVNLPRRVRARRRARSGRCAGCGYDLRGCMSGRCPECGATIPDVGDPQANPAAAHAVNRVSRLFFVPSSSKEQKPGRS